MHELSLALEVIDLVEKETGRREISGIREILIEVGTLSGVEADAFQSALEMIGKGTVLENAEIILERTPGKGHCSLCDLDFEMSHRMECCPQCHCFPSGISGGDQFRVISLLTK